MDVNRRTFLKLSGLAATGTVVGGLTGLTAARASVRDGIPGIKGKVMLNDVARCIGCLSCAIACKRANELPNPFEYSPVTGGDAWTTVQFQQLNKDDQSSRVNLKIQCMHCSQPTCVAVCPTGAAQQRDDGIVIIDQNTCIGCKYCVFGCPFDIPGPTEETGTVRKCTFCEKRLGEGKIPACAEACPVEAITFGELEGMLEKAKARVEHLKGQGFPNAVIYGQKELGGLKVIYVLPFGPDEVGLPPNPKQATEDTLAKWTVGLIAAGALVLGPLRTVFEVKNEDGPQSEVSRDG